MLRIRYAIMVRFRLHLATILVGTALSALFSEQLLPGAGIFVFVGLAVAGSLHLAKLLHLPIRVAALHEAAHATVAWHIAQHPPPERALLSTLGGAVVFGKEDDTSFLRDEDAIPLPVLEAHILVLLAGIAAEEHLGRMPVIGGFSDLAKGIHYSRVHARRIRDARGPEAFLGSCMGTVRTLVAEHWQTIERLATALEERKELSGEDIATILGPRPSKD